VAIALALAAARTYPALLYDRAAILRGEAWRLLTASLVHADAGHLLLNLAGLALVWLAFHPRLSALGWAAASGSCALGATLGVLALDPGVRYLAGLSSVLHGLAAAGGVLEVRRRHALGWVFLAAVALKVAWDLTEGRVPVATRSHLYGAVTGLVAGLVLRPSPARAGAP
jgi:rhomboid family GlyGly-CTERM serine protease